MRSQVKGLESKIDKTYFIHTIPGQFHVKQNWFQHFPVLGLQISKDTSQKKLTRIFKFGCFSWYHAYIFEENELNTLMQNLMLNRLTPIPNPKNEKVKSSYVLFHLLFFILRPISLNKGFSPFRGHFGQLGNFFQFDLKLNNQGPSIKYVRKHRERES